MTVGDTTNGLPYPTKVPPQLPEYHAQEAPVPRVVGLVTVSVEDPPLQIGEVPEVVGATVDEADPLTAIVVVTQFVLLQVPSARA